MFRFIRRRQARRLATLNTDVLVLAAEDTLDHWATVTGLRYTYPADTGGTSTGQQPLPLGAGGTATAILTLTDRRTGRSHILTTSDITAVLPGSGVQLPVGGPADVDVDYLIQFAVFGTGRYFHPSVVLASSTCCAPPASPATSSRPAVAAPRSSSAWTSAPADPASTAPSCSPDPAGSSATPTTPGGCAPTAAATTSTSAPTTSDKTPTPHGCPGSTSPRPRPKRTSPPGSSPHFPTPSEQA